MTVSSSFAFCGEKLSLGKYQAPVWQGFTEEWTATAHIGRYDKTHSFEFYLQRYFPLLLFIQLYCIKTTWSFKPKHRLSPPSAPPNKTCIPSQMHTTFPKTTSKARDYCIYIAYILGRQTNEQTEDHVKSTHLAHARWWRPSHIGSANCTELIPTYVQHWESFKAHEDRKDWFVLLLLCEHRRALAG